jgi:hypothetical protein
VRCTICNKAEQTKPPMSSFREQVKLNQQITENARALTEQRLASISEKANERYKSSKRVSYQSMLTERLVAEAVLSHKHFQEEEQEGDSTFPTPRLALRADNLDRIADLNFGILSAAEKLRRPQTEGREGSVRVAAGLSSSVKTVAELSKLNSEIFLDESHQGLTAVNEHNRFLEKQREKIEARLAREARERTVLESKAEIEEVAAKAQSLQRQKLRMEANEWRTTRTRDANTCQEVARATEHLKSQREKMAHREERAAHLAESAQYLNS